MDDAYIKDLVDTLKNIAETLKSIDTSLQVLAGNDNEHSFING